MPTNRSVRMVHGEALGGDYHLLTFAHAEVAREARAGQFVMIKPGDSAEPPLRRPFSILAADPARETFSLFIKAVGSSSLALARMAEGDTAQCLGPLGHPFTPPEPGVEALLVAGGFGVAPFHLLCRQLQETRGSIPARLYYGGRTVKDLRLRHLFEELGVPVEVCTEDGSAGMAGLVTQALVQRLETSRTPAKLYACGPQAMMRAVAGIAAERGLPAEVSLDPWMGCGFGTCLGCVVPIQTADQERPKNRCACTEGPVFDAATVVWPDEMESIASVVARRQVERTQP